MRIGDFAWHAVAVVAVTAVVAVVVAERSKEKNLTLSAVDFDAKEDDQFSKDL